MATDENNESGNKPVKHEDKHLLTPFEEMDRIFENFLHEGWPKSWMRPFQWNYPAWPEKELPFTGRIPRVDIIDRKDDILIRAEVPGVKKGNLDISVSNRTVTLSGWTEEHKEEEQGNYYRAETRRGRFSRTVNLPCEVDGDQASAKLEDGLLKLSVPKLARSRHRNIPVE